jgi:hypothetical protein
MAVFFGCFPFLGYVDRHSLWVGALAAAALVRAGVLGFIRFGPWRF